MIKREPDFVAKDTDFDIVWLLTKIQLASTGIDLKANKILQYTEAAQTLFVMPQGETESNEEYKRRFEGNVDRVIAAKGTKILCPVSLGEYTDPNIPTEQELSMLQDKV